MLSKLDNWREERYIHCEHCGKLHLEDIKCSCELDERNDTENIVYIIGLNSYLTIELPQIIRVEKQPFLCRKQNIGYDENGNSWLWGKKHLNKTVFYDENVAKKALINLQAIIAEQNTISDNLSRVLSITSCNNDFKEKIKGLTFMELKAALEDSEYCYIKSKITALRKELDNRFNVLMKCELF